MSAGLLSLLDDVAAIAKMAAASVDDVAAGAFKATSNAAGVVIDDTAVTPKYVVGLSPARELPIVWNIAKGSLRNKLLFLLPGIMLLGYLVPWMVNPLLALGALYLCFEGYEKLQHAAQKTFAKKSKDSVSAPQPISTEELEKIRTAGAIRTDFVLSAEIMAIGYATVQEESFWIKLSALIAVAFCITAGVYGVVALILKADDVGMRMVTPERSSWVRGIGRLLVHQMPKVLAVLSAIGTAAMLWVGGGIIIHSIHPLQHNVIEPLVQGIDNGILGWLIEALVSLVVAIPIGFAVALAVHYLRPQSSDSHA